MPYVSVSAKRFVFFVAKNSLNFYLNNNNNESRIKSQPIWIEAERHYFWRWLKESSGSKSRVKSSHQLNKVTIWNVKLHKQVCS